jgi:adenylate cyclase
MAMKRPAQGVARVTIPGAMQETRAGAGTDELNRWQRMALRRVLRAAGKKPNQSLESDDWATYFALTFEPSNRAWSWMMRRLPSNPRCGVCSAPFAGIGSRLVRPLGYHPSRKNPNICATCVELAPPGGMKMQAGVLFADIRGFTAMSERSDPEQVMRVLRRFYACAEDILFPAAFIDKLVGDQVMALYLPQYRLPAGSAGPDGLTRVAPIMVDQARKLLGSIGYGTEEGPFVEVGVGMDFGEAFVGNIGEGSVRDFTAVGDVVNTASRLQSVAGGGEILISERIAARLDERPPVRAEVDVKGKAAPVTAYRINA